VKLFIPFLFFAASLFAADEWPGVKFAEVRAYAWKTGADGPPPEENLIREDMTLVDGVINKDGGVLTAEQVKRLLAAVTGEHEKHPVAECYTPHNAFLFYNAEKKPVAYVEICFDCLSTRKSQQKAPEWVDLPALAKLFEELKLPIGKYADAAALQNRLTDFKRPSKTDVPDNSKQDAKTK